MNDEYQYPHSLVSLPVLQGTGTPNGAPNGPMQAEVANDANPESVSTVTGSNATDPTRFVEHKLIEGKVIEAALRVMEERKPQLLEFGVTNNEAWEVGLPCGGTIRIFVEGVE